jgi:hypothetical protein
VEKPRELRRTPRYPFIAVAEVTDAESGGPLNAQVAELSLNGCYLDMLNPLKVKSRVTVKIFAEGECCEAMAEVRKPILRRFLAISERQASEMH